MKFRNKYTQDAVNAYQAGKEIDIQTPDGIVRACIGDWIVTDAFGRQFPCKSYIFEETYEPIDELMYSFEY